eukprot:scpid12991/ scgid5261/ DNA2-like helicase; DNA replication ATP-dependent helicase-like homolog
MGKLSLKLKKTASKPDAKDKPSGQTSIQTFFTKGPAVKQSPLFSRVGDKKTKQHSQIESSALDSASNVHHNADDDLVTVSDHEQDSDTVIEATPTKSDIVIDGTPSKDDILVPDTPDKLEASPVLQPSPFCTRKPISLRRKHSLPSDSSPPAKLSSKAKSPGAGVKSGQHRLPAVPVSSDSSVCPSVSHAASKSNPFAVATSSKAVLPPSSPLDILSQYSGKASTSTNGSRDSNDAGTAAVPVRTHGESSNSKSASSAVGESQGYSRHSVLGCSTANSASSTSLSPLTTVPSCSVRNATTTTTAGVAATSDVGSDIGNASGVGGSGGLADSSITDEDLILLYGQIASSPTPTTATTTAATSHNPQSTSSSDKNCSPLSQRRKIPECSSPTRQAHVNVKLPTPKKCKEPPCTGLSALVGDSPVPATPQKSAAITSIGSSPGANTSLTAEDYSALLESCLQMTPMKESPLKSSATKDKAAASQSQNEKHAVVYRRFLVLEVYTRDATVTNGQASWTVSEKVLRLLDERHSEERQCLLRDDWLQTSVEPGDIVHISGQFDTGGHCLLANSPGHHGHVVVQPDTLISTTSVAMATRCLRRAVLGERFKGGGSDVTEALLIGVLVHELFDMAMKAGDFSLDYTRRTARQLSQRQDFLHMMYAAQQTQEGIMEKILQQLATLQEWSAKFLHKEPKIAQGALDMASTFQSPSDEKHSLAISKLQDIEENIWSPRYGLKGKVDATIEVKIHKRRPLSDTRNKPAARLPAVERVRWSQVPLELKTGRQTASLGTVDHRAQVILYTMMLSDAHVSEVPAGLLLYSKTGKMLSVPAQEHELRALLMRRNELARYLSLGISPSSAWTAHRGAGLLPAMLQDEHTCRYCPQLATCALLHKSVENGTAESSGMGKYFEEATEHVSQEQLDFFADWYRLVGLEASCASAENALHSIWTVPAEERISAGQCFGNLQVDQAQRRGGSSSWKTRFTSANQHQQQQQNSQLSDGGSSTAGSTSLLDIPISPGEMIVLSEQNGRVALCTGFLVDVGLHHVEIVADRQLPGHNSEGDPILYCVDANAGLNVGGALWGNLAHLFIANEDRDSRIRSLIVDLSPPRFARSSILTRASAFSQSQLPCTFSAKQFQSFSAQADKMDQVEELLDTLNSDQRHAIDRALCAQDYALILGMPGTGKTTTIACLVRILVLCGRSVLLTSYTHSAVDNILLKLIADGVDFVRLGQRHKVHPAVHPYLSEVACSQFSTVSQLEHFYTGKKVMATTCHGIGHSALARQSFDVCIVDEASQITMLMCFGPIRLAETFVLVGDQYQLPPLVQSSLAREGGMSVSLFRRLAEAHPAAVTNLRHQYRMHKDLMLLSNTLVYSHRLKCGTDQVASSLLRLPNWTQLSSHQTDPTAAWLLKTLSPEQPVVFLNTDQVPGTEQNLPGLVYNEVEAALVGVILKSLLKAGLPAADVGVISIYRQQLKAISRLLKQLEHRKGGATHTADSLDASTQSSVPASSLQAVEVNTVDRYQGRDKPCVIVSLVRSNTSGKVGQLLLDWRRANVAVTRAKHKLILIGSVSTLRRSHLFKLLLDLVQEHDWIVDAPLGAHLTNPC